MMENENIEKNLPVMMYLHGFMSGANGSKPRQLQGQFGNRYRVIAPELTADPEYSLALIDRIIEEEKPEIVIGTSLGAWMALACHSGDAAVVVVNPVTDPEKQLERWVGEEQNYFCKRLDGVQTYTLTAETLAKYEKYKLWFRLGVSSKSDRLFALCSTADELLGHSHARMLRNLLPESQVMIVNDFGHQCRDAGMTHLYELIERAIAHKDDPGMKSDYTFEEFRANANREPDLSGEWVYELQRVDVCCEAEYPMFDVDFNSYYFHSLEEAERYMREKLAPLSPLEDTYCFLIEQLPVGAHLFYNRGARWSYDADGRLVDYALAEMDDEESVSFGRTSNRLRFRKGDMVEFLEGEVVRLAIVADDGPTVEAQWQKYCDVRNGKLHSKRSLSEHYTLLDGVGKVFIHPASPTRIFAPRKPIPDDVREYFNRSLAETLKDSREVRKYYQYCHEPIDEPFTASVSVNYDEDTHRHHLVKVETCRATGKEISTPITSENAAPLRDWLTGVLFGKSRLWYLIREWNRHCDPDLN